MADYKGIFVDVSTIPSGTFKMILVNEYGQTVTMEIPESIQSDYQQFISDNMARISNLEEKVKRLELSTP